MQVCVFVSSVPALEAENKYRIEFLLLVRPQDTQERAMQYVVNMGDLPIALEEGYDPAPLFGTLPVLYAAFHENPAPVSRLADMQSTAVIDALRRVGLDAPVLLEVRDMGCGPVVLIEAKKGVSGPIAFAVHVGLSMDDWSARTPSIMCSVPTVHRTFVCDPAGSFTDCEITTLSGGGGLRVARLKEATEATRPIYGGPFPTRRTNKSRLVTNTWRYNGNEYVDDTWLNLVEVRQEKLKSRVPSIYVAGMPLCLRTPANAMPLPWVQPEMPAVVRFTARKRHISVIVTATRGAKYRFKVHLLHDRNIAQDGTPYLTARLTSRSP
jgi:hypothetical protein